jgi:HAD superfamily hydrolase (TIGR01549 family)
MRAVLWDLDDTLLDTLSARMRALNYAYAQCLGGPVDPLELWKSHRGGSLEALGQRLLGADAQKFTTAYRNYYYGQEHRVAVFPGVEEVLTALQEHGLLLAVVTSKISWGATEELEEAGLLRFFRAVVGHDDVERAKPDPAPIFEAMSRIVVDDPADVLFVGDSPADMFAARNAGCIPVAATWGTVDRELLLDTSPAFVAQRPADVLAALSGALGRSS